VCIFALEGDADGLEAAAKNAGAEVLRRAEGFSSSRRSTLVVLHAAGGSGSSSSSSNPFASHHSDTAAAAAAICTGLQDELKGVTA